MEGPMQEMTEQAEEKTMQDPEKNTGTETGPEGQEGMPEETEKTEETEGTAEGTEEEKPGDGAPDTPEEKKKTRAGKPSFPLIAACAAAAVFLVLFLVTASRLGALQTEYDRVSGALASAAGSNEELSGKNGDLSSQVAELAAENEALKKELQSTGSENEALEKQNGELRTQIEEKEARIGEISTELEELKNGADAALVKIRNAYEEGDWDTVVSLAAGLHEKYNGSEADKEGQSLAEKAQAELDAAAAAAEAEKAKGYETGITYDQLARTPDDYFGSKVKFTGKVVQVLEGDDSVDIRLAVNSDYDTILYGQYEKSILSSRILEDDVITIFGTSLGTISYQSTMGGKITIPGVYIEKIEIQ